MAVTLTDGPLTLRPFTTNDLNDFSALHANPQVMHDLGGPISTQEAQAKLEGYMAAYDRHGYARWAVFHQTVFAGYVGVMHLSNPDHPLGPHDEIGWRLFPATWGQGVATRAARLALTDAFDRVGLDHVLAYTVADNLRSQAVMTRLGLTRQPDMDFEEYYPPIGAWKGMVWRITAEAWAAQRAGGIE